MTRVRTSEHLYGLLEAERDELRRRVAALESQLNEARARTEALCEVLGIPRWDDYAGFLEDR